MNKAEENMFGGNDGKAWDDGSYKFVRKITVAYGQCIYSIRVVYDEKGAPVEKDEHGGGGSSITKRFTIELDYPREFLKMVSGYINPVIIRGPKVIRQLTFKSNKTTYGPYGEKIGTPFSFPVNGAKILGFKGRSEDLLIAIGSHLSKESFIKVLTKEVKRRLKN